MILVPTSRIAEGKTGIVGCSPLNWGRQVRSARADDALGAKRRGGGSGGVGGWGCDRECARSLRVQRELVTLGAVLAILSRQPAQLTMRTTGRL